jgi:hypothetical protein
MQNALLRNSLETPYAGGFQGTIFEEFHINQDQLKAAFKLCLSFWENFVEIIGILESHNVIPQALMKQFSQANDFLKDHMKKLG